MPTRSFFVLALTALCVTAYAQTDARIAVANEQAAALIDSVMHTINIRADIFNEEISKVNKLRPLEVENLTKEKVAENIPLLREFLSYLEVYRVTSDHEKARIADSVEALRAYVPKARQKKYLKDFMDAYMLDQNAFYTYTTALTALYTNVLELLNFMTTATTEIKDGKIAFQDRAQYRQYGKILAKVEKSVKKQSAASVAAQKATFDAGQIMQKAYGKLHN